MASTSEIAFNELCMSQGHVAFRADAPLDAITPTSASSFSKQVPAAVSAVISRVQHGVMRGHQTCTMQCMRVSADWPQSPALQLVKEAEAQLLQLVAQLKAPHLAALPSAVAVVAIRAAGAVAQQRPQLLGRIMPTLVGLASARLVSLCY